MTTAKFVDHYHFFQFTKLYEDILTPNPLMDTDELYEIVKAEYDKYQESPISKQQISDYECISEYLLKIREIRKPKVKVRITEHIAGAESYFEISEILPSGAKSILAHKKYDYFQTDSRDLWSRQYNLKQAHEVAKKYEQSKQEPIIVYQTPD